MEDGKHLNFITHDFIEHCERESANNSASEVPINKREEMRIIDDTQQGIVYTLHKLQIQILALVRIPLASLGEFGIRLRSKSNMHVRLTLHEFILDLVPCSPLARIASRRLQSPVKLPLLSVCQLKCFVFFSDRVPDLLD